jgi:hypothetical protein
MACHNEGIKDVALDTIALYSLVLQDSMSQTSDFNLQFSDYLSHNYISYLLTI